MIDFKQYIQELQSIPIDEITEHSKRSALESILHQASVIQQTKKIMVLQEPKRKDNYGSPDFKIYSENSIIGYVENKKITENLDKILQSEQIKRYRELSQNLIITNYREFVWIKGEVIQRETLVSLSDMENKKFKLDNEKAEKVGKLLTNFFSQTPQKITDPQNLAIALAIRCKNLKDFIEEELTRQNEQNEPDILYELYKAFKDNIFEELAISEFSDAFAQMLTYSLFLAGLNADTKVISIKTAKDFIPSHFQLLKELYKFFEVLEKSEYKETKWIIDEIISIINNIQWFDLQQNLSFYKKVKNSENIETDPYIYFYETFLATYDYNLRKAKGVYYTPPQVVNFIVRSIHEILINTFKLPDGLAENNKVTVLDFATGTGTFLLEVFKIILENIPKESSEKRNMIIRDHILKNLFGFEYLIAPYTIAHLKLSQFLKENGYEFIEKDRLQVYLTNTLEPVDKQIKVPFMPQLTKETRTAQEIKDTPILVITGNPPYSGHSKNSGDWIKNEIKKYKFVDGKPLEERNPKWLQDDYVKFIRFAQDKMDKAEHGIVGIITNHSFLDNPTFRGMRQSLMNSFDQLYFIDLHGNSKKKEKTPDGSKDENIFDIQQGVCISILIKKKGLEKGIFHTDFWGDRTTKFETCLNNSLPSVNCSELKPNTPFYLFVPQNQNFRYVYDKFWSLKDIFDVNSVGIVTSNDSLTIAYNKTELEKRFHEVKKSEPHIIKQEFNLQNNYFESRKNFFFKIKEKQLEMKEINYRVFDKRFLWWDMNLLERSRENVMKHFEKENVGLITTRQARPHSGSWHHVFATKYITEACYISNKGGEINYLFPLYYYNGNGNGGNYLFKEDDKRDNFTEKFRTFIKTKYASKSIDKKEIQTLETIIKELQKQLKQTEKFILSLEESGVKNGLLHIQKQLFKDLQTQIDIKKRELQEKTILQNTNYQPSPEEIFGYIYAILHSETYREKYSEFLKSDFPCIPFVETLTQFEILSKLGEELVEKHLMKKPFAFKELPELGNYPIAGDNMVVNPEYKTIRIENKIHQRFYINKTQYFETVPEEVYNFQIGGYQVLDKYLKDRKGRSIADDLFHITEMIKTISFTIEQMKKIDNETKEWI